MKRWGALLLLTASVAAHSNGIQCDELHYAEATVCDATLNGHHTYTETQTGEGHSEIKEISQHHYEWLLELEHKTATRVRHEHYCAVTEDGPKGEWKQWRAVHCEGGKLKQGEK